MSLLSKYKEGACRAVWEQIASWDTREISESRMSEADEVVREVISRTDSNIQTLANRLDEMGYQFGNPSGPFRYANGDDHQKLEELQEAWGQFPQIIEALYTRFSYVDFSQDETQLLDEGEFKGVGYCPQLLLLSLSGCEELRKENEAAYHSDNEFMTELMESRGKTYEPEELGSLLLLGPVASNDSMKGFSLPAFTYDDHYFNDGFGPTLFYTDLAYIFECGGIPQLKKYATVLPKLGPQDPQGLLDRLRPDLLPL